MGMTVSEAVKMIEFFAENGPAVERMPFLKLAEELSEYFNIPGSFKAAQAEDQAGAITEARRIISEHVREAKIRLLRDQVDKVDMNDWHSLTSALPQLARRAADLRFVDKLQGF